MFTNMKMAVLSAIPTSSNRYAKSFAAAVYMGLSLKDPTIEQMSKASSFIENDEFLINLEMNKRAVEYFNGYYNTQPDPYDLLLEIKACPDEYRANLRVIIGILSSISSTQEKALYALVTL